MCHEIYEKLIRISAREGFMVLEHPPETSETSKNVQLMPPFCCSFWIVNNYEQLHEMLETRPVQSSLKGAPFIFRR
jgi:hypothetical protein